MLNKNNIKKHRLKLLVLGAGLVLGALYVSILKPVSESRIANAHDHPYDRNGGAEVASLRVVGTVFTILGLFGYKLHLEEKFGSGKKAEKHKNDQGDKFDKKK